MIHGPCGGKKNPKCPCTDIEKKCTKRFPKAFVDETSVDKDGYPMYKRRDNGRKATKLGHDLDNGLVVPYNPLLLKRYQAHINVEWCNQIGAIRYLLKYINKGNDRVAAGVCDEEIDEIKEYYDCRYVSSCEAVWRILSFDIHHRNPIVIRLAFHLEGEQSIVFDEEDFIESVLDRPTVNNSMFLEWMICNQINKEARKLTYVDFPTQFVWNKDKRVRGPTSYEDIRTVNGKICSSTFKDACYEVGLLDDDQEYIDGIKKTSTWGSGHVVRRLFA
ncbi:uncharacterized protein [Rutidosis leptorrhynchoides]|uniref:uncharacterized protein n=1 Tax=Rutidosis leptorrhynchoides TaxID=125765 RepID=UPI003A9A5D6E